MKILYVFLFLLATANSLAADGVRYVNENSTSACIPLAGPPEVKCAESWGDAYDTLTEAVSDLNAHDGGVIYIAEGTYSGGITIGTKPIKLEGAGTGATIIAGAVTIAQNGSIIRNLAISIDSGDSLTISNASDVLISNTKIENDDGYDCVSIVNARRIKIVDSQIRNCKNGISMDEGSSVFISNVLVDGIPDGAGLWVDSGEGLSTVHVANSQFMFSGENSYGIYLGGSDPTEKTYSVIANTKTNGGDEGQHIHVGTSGNQIVNHSFIGDSDVYDVTFGAEGNVLGQYTSTDSVDVDGGSGNSVWTGY